MTAQTLAERIRPMKARTARRTTLRAQPERTLAGLAQRERIEAELVPYLDTLREAIPELQPKRRLFDGAWVLGVQADLPSGTFKGRPYFAYTRLEFALRLMGDGTVELSASTTIYDRDLPTERFTGRLDAADLGELTIFAEHQALLFATRFFERAPRHRGIPDAI